MPRRFQYSKTFPFVKLNFPGLEFNLNPGTEIRQEACSATRFYYVSVPGTIFPRTGFEFSNSNPNKKRLPIPLQTDVRYGSVVMVGCVPQQRNQTTTPYVWQVQKYPFLAYGCNFYTGSCSTGILLRAGGPTEYSLRAGTSTKVCPLLWCSSIFVPTSPTVRYFKYSNCVFYRSTFVHQYEMRIIQSLK